MNVVQKILFTTVLLIAIPMLILGVTGVSQVFLMSQDNVEDSAASLSEEAQDNLERIVNSQAEFIDDTFSQVISNVELLHDYTYDLYTGAINVTPRESYSSVNPPSYIPGEQYDEDYKWSTEVSSWYYPNTVITNKNNHNYNSLNESLKWEVNLTSNLDVPLKMILEGNPNFAYVYFIAPSGFMRSLPWDDVTELYYNKGWDARKEDFYLEPIAVGNEGKVIISNPYVDVYAGLMISFGKAVYFPNGSLIGVVSMDLTASSLKAAVLEVEVSETGRSFLLDSDKNCVAHPDLGDEDDPKSLQSLEGISTSEFSTIVDKAMDGESGVDTFEKEGKIYYYAYAYIPSTQFSIGIIVPKDEVIAPAITLRNNANIAIITQLGLLLIVLVVLIILIAGAVWFQSNKIVAPISELSTVCKIMGEGDLSVDPREIEGGGREIQALSVHFSGLVTALRFGNDDYYLGDLQRAFENYDASLQLFTTLKNRQGVGICHNNLGNIYRAWGDLDRAKESYEKAIEIAKELNAKKALASRYNNLALVLIALKQYEKAINLLENAKSIDSEIDNVRGLTTRLANLGLAYIKKGDKGTALKHYLDAIELSKEREDVRSSAYANHYMANFYLGIKQLTQAEKHFGIAWESAQLVNDIRLKTKIANKLSETYKELEDPVQAGEWKRTTRDLQDTLTPRKVLLFVLDYSGSMAGPPIRAAVKGAIQVLDKIVNPQDMCSVISFSSRSNVVVQLSEMSDPREEQRLRGKLSSLAVPYGRTALYDAAGDAIELATSLRGNFRRWVILLTDGADNSSYRFSPAVKAPRGVKSIPGLMERNRKALNLVVIDLSGHYETGTILENLVKNTSRGRYIRIKDLYRIETSINEAFTEVEQLMAEVEVEKFESEDV